MCCETRVYMFSDVFALGLNINESKIQIAGIIFKCVMIRYILHSHYFIVVLQPILVYVCNMHSSVFILKTDFVIKSRFRATHLVHPLSRTGIKLVFKSSLFESTLKANFTLVCCDFASCACSYADFRNFILITDNFPTVC